MEKIEIIMRRAGKDSISETVLASFDVAHPSVLNQDKNILNFPGLSIHLNEHSVYRDRRLVLLHSAASSGRWCGGQRPLSAGSGRAN